MGINTCIGYISSIMRVLLALCLVATATAASLEITGVDNMLPQIPQAALDAPTPSDEVLASFALVDAQKQEKACGVSKYGCSAGASLTVTRIVGGTDALVNEFPWQVSLKYRGSHSCGGSIINNRYILTAAHCVQGSMATASSWKAVLGNHRLMNTDSTQKEVSISRVTAHPSYKKLTNDYDVAIMQMSSTVSLNSNIATVCLASASSGDFNGQTGIVTGWGTTRSGGSLANTLQKVAVPIITNTLCKSWYAGYTVTDRMICAGLERGGKDSCQGDSGGPMVIKSSGCTFNQVGIVSWGVGCAGAKKPGVYTRVSKVASWINSNSL